MFEIIVVSFVSLVLIVCTIFLCVGLPLSAIERALYRKTMKILKGETEWKSSKTDIFQELNSRTYKLEFKKNGVPLTIECHSSGLTHVNCNNPIVNRTFNSTRVYKYLENFYKMKEVELNTIENL